MESLAANPWAMASMAAKLISLLGIAGVVGGSFSIYLGHSTGFGREPRLWRYLLFSAALGLGATLVFFLAQVGAINQAGLAGVLDVDMALILAQTSHGYMTGLRGLGFSAVLVACLLWQVSAGAGSRIRARQAGMFCLIAAIALLGLSFALTGHVSELSAVARAALILHVLAAFLWLGSLYPLLRLSTVANMSQVQRLMRLFGAAALLIVGVLLISGIFLLTRLVQSLDALFTTAYGLTLLAKLAGVSCLLALAAINKLLLVPRLTARASGAHLRASIRTEIIVAVLVLAATTWLTTAVGPAI